MVNLDLISSSQMEAICDHAHKEDIMTIMQRTRRLIIDKWNEVNAVRVASNQNQQCSENRSTLTRKMMLMPRQDE